MGKENFIDDFLGNIDWVVEANKQEFFEDSRPKVKSKNCIECRAYKDAQEFPASHSRFHHDKLGNVCFECLEKLIGEPDKNLEIVDEILQDLNTGFDVQNWLTICYRTKVRVLKEYLRLYGSSGANRVNWTIIRDEWIAAVKRREISKKMDQITQEEIAELRLRWGSEYDDEYLRRLEHTYREIENTQSVVTEIQRGHAKKMCMLSMQIEELIKAGDNHKSVKDLIAAYDSLAKTADFTPKNAKNVGDFESVGELYAFLERRGWVNKFYDWKVRDKPDEVIENLQAYNKRIIMGESGISDELNRKLENLRISQELEDDMSMDKFDKYTTVDIEEDLTQELDEELKIE